ncbi:MAG TPA: hypothetical protein VGB50_02530 [Flavobacterium sp.]|jgi:hypothetical protein
MNSLRKYFSGFYKSDMMPGEPNPAHYYLHQAAIWIVIVALVLALRNVLT